MTEDVCVRVHVHLRECVFGCVVQSVFGRACDAEHTDVSFRGGYQWRRAEKGKGAKCMSLGHAECEWRLVVP